MSHCSCITFSAAPARRNKRFIGGHPRSAQRSCPNYVGQCGAGHEWTIAGVKWPAEAFAPTAPPADRQRSRQVWPIISYWFAIRQTRPGCACSLWPLLSRVTLIEAFPKRSIRRLMRSERESRSIRTMPEVIGCEPGQSALRNRSASRRAEARRWVKPAKREISVRVVWQAFFSSAGPAIACRFARYEAFG